MLALPILGSLAILWGKHCPTLSLAEATVECRSVAILVDIHVDNISLDTLLEDEITSVSL